MIAGVISLGAEPVDAAERLRRRSAPEIADRVLRRRRAPANAKVPSSASGRRRDLLAGGSRSSSVTPGSPSSPCSTIPGLPPPGLKSRQTTPVMPSGFAGGVDRLLGAVRDVLGRDRRQAEHGDAARLERRLQRERAAGLADELRRGRLRRRQHARRLEHVLTDRDRGVDRAPARVLVVHQPPDHARREAARSPSA